MQESSKYRALFTSVALHGVALFGTLAGYLYLGDVDNGIGIAVALGIVAGVGIWKGARHGRSSHGWYVAGAVVASAAFTVVGVCLLWLLTYPTGNPEPLWDYFTWMAGSAKGVLGMAVPTAATVAATLLGAEIGRLMRRRHGKAAHS
jgi:integral membrane sensor domain MASE1